MKKTKKMSLPTQIAVQIQKGDSGVLIATIDEYNSVTEADVFPTLRTQGVQVIG